MSLTIEDINNLERENKLLKDELYRKSEIEQCVQDLMEENTKLKKILVDIGFWDSEGNYKEDYQEVDVREMKHENESKG